ncbi:MAG: Hsp70 family protein [Chloroflexi bacterium]|nr:Hsp70 family protein [Chloroflexota bacterium]
MDNPTRIYGIDLGTTYSCIAYVDEYGKPVVVPGEGNNLVTPSVVYFASESNVVVGSVAKDYALLLPKQIVELVKRDMGRSDRTWEFFGKTYRPEDVSSLILRKLAAFAEQYTGTPVTDVVITVPAYFNAAERTATEQAGQLAGFKVHAIIPEPTAAAIFYSISATERQTVLVYDLGGGTFDVTVIDVSGGQISVVCTDGDRNLGGRDWDNALVAYFVNEWQSQNDSTEDPLEDLETRQQFQSTAERAKRQLMNVDTAPVILTHNALPAKVMLTRQKFDELTEHLLARSIDLTHKVLATAKNKGYANVSKILLVGGSSYMPQVARRLNEEIGIPMELVEPEQSVAKGAAIYAANRQIQDLYNEAIQLLFGPGATPEKLTGDQKAQASAQARKRLPGTTQEGFEEALSKKIINVCSKTFGVIVQRAPGELEIYYLIKKDSRVPAEVAETFGTVENNQREVLIRVIESNGDNLPDTEPLPLPDHAMEIGQAVLKLPPSLPAHSPVKVRYSLSDDGGNLHAEAEEMKEHNKVEVDVKLTNALTQKQIEERRESNLLIKVS